MIKRNTIEDKDRLFNSPPERKIWQKPVDIKIKLIEIIKLIEKSPK